MADKQLTAREVASLVDGTLSGDPDVVVTGVESLQLATAGDTSFLGNQKYEPQVVPSGAGIVLVPETFETPAPTGRAWILCADPSAAFTRIVACFAPPPVPRVEGIHPTAVVSDQATIADSASIGPNAVVEAGAVIGEKSVIGAGSYVGHEAVLGKSCQLFPNVTIRERCRLGNGVIIHSGTTIGSDGFGYIPGKDGHRKIPQVGIVQIDDDVEIGAQVAIDRARFGKTWIKTGAKIDNLVQIAHNVVVGEYCFIIAQVGISGSTELGRNVIAAGQVGIAGHLTIDPGITIMAQSGVSRDLVSPRDNIVFGSPAVPRKEFARKEFAVKNVAKLKLAIQNLEQELADLKARVADRD